MYTLKTKSSFTKPNEDLPLKVCVLFSFPRVSVCTFVFICVGVMPKESTHETEASMRAEDNEKSLSTLVIAPVSVQSCKEQEKLTMATLGRGNHRTASSLNLSCERRKSIPPNKGDS